MECKCPKNYEDCQIFLKFDSSSLLKRAFIQGDRIHLYGYELCIVEGNGWTHLKRSISKPLVPVYRMSYNHNVFRESKRYSQNETGKNLEFFGLHKVSVQEVANSFHAINFLFLIFQHFIHSR